MTPVTPDSHRSIYSGRGFREWEIGDIDIIRHEGVYHLFHLVLPNHDYIAHATSRDCINWTRVKNALFVGDPGEWDDDMLWTMNVVPMPEGGFEMFYTGLSQKENGVYQRIGRATSQDLFEWEKDPEPPYPVESAAPHYESPSDNLRQWVSFRDPFHFRDHDGTRFLLVCARVTRGPISRRGCVGLLRIEAGHIHHEEPLFVPYAYDDVECPAAVEINGRTYLIGSIREDIKVHYWVADQFRGPYQSFVDNILLPEGNYAARVSSDGDRILLYSFFVTGPDVLTAHRYFCPPKELDTDETGRLVLRSLRHWQDKIAGRLEQSGFPPVRALFGNPATSLAQSPETITASTSSGYEIFAFPSPFPDFLWRGTLEILHPGKLGLIFNANHNGDGYYLSLDPRNHLIRLRAWATRPEDIHKDYLFEDLQINGLPGLGDGPFRFELLRYGYYIELSINGVVQLSLIDAKFSGALLGIYTDSATIQLSESSLLELKDSDEDELSQHFDSAAKDWRSSPSG